MIKIEKPKNSTRYDTTKLIVIAPKKDITASRVIPKQVNSNKQEVKIDIPQVIEPLFRIY